MAISACSRAATAGREDVPVLKMVGHRPLQPLVGHRRKLGLLEVCCLSRISSSARAETSVRRALDSGCSVHCPGRPEGRWSRDRPLSESGPVCSRQRCAGMLGSMVDWAGSAKQARDNLLAGREQAAARQRADEATAAEGARTRAENFHAADAYVDDFLRKAEAAGWPQAERSRHRWYSPTEYSYEYYSRRFEDDLDVFTVSSTRYWRLYTTVDVGHGVAEGREAVRRPNGEHEGELSPTGPVSVKVVRDHLARFAAEAGIDL